MCSPISQERLRGEIDYYETVYILCNKGNTAYPARQAHDAHTLRYASGDDADIRLRHHHRREERAHCGGDITNGLADAKGGGADITVGVFHHHTNSG